EEHDHAEDQAGDPSQVPGAVRREGAYLGPEVRSGPDADHRGDGSGRWGLARLRVPEVRGPAPRHARPCLRPARLMRRFRVVIEGFVQAVDESAAAKDAARLARAGGIIEARTVTAAAEGTAGDVPESVEEVDLVALAHGSPLPEEPDA